METMFLTTTELAARWQVTAKTIRNRRSSGAPMPIVTYLGRPRFAISDVVAFEESKRTAN